MRDLWARPLLAGLFTYLFTLGATFNGVVLPDIGAFTLWLLAVGLLLWALIHWLRGWQWQRTPLDPMLPIALLAITLSLITNLDHARIIQIGIWYGLVYLGVWLLLNDLMTHGALKRVVLIDAILIAGAVIVGFGYLQLNTLLNSGEPFQGLFGLPRPSSLIGNPNSFAAFLIVILALAIGRCFTVTRLMQAVLFMFIGAILGLLLLSYSRGGWIGAIAAIGISVLLTLAAEDLLHPVKFWGWMRSRALVIQIGIAISAIGGGIAAGTIGMLLWRSLSAPGRSADLRTYLWEGAWQLFIQRPITGHGLYRYGWELDRLESMPPGAVHSHAHNLPLNVLAELGLIGGIALIAAMILTGIAMRHNWQTATKRERRLLIGGIAGTIGIGIHHLLDLPAMMPLIALMALLTLALAIVPLQSQPIRAAWRRTLQTGAIFGIGIALIFSGWTSNRLYGQYIAILREAVATENYQLAADRLDALSRLDPALPIYAWQSGTLYGLAISQLEATPANASQINLMAARGISAYRRALQFAPENAILWANLGALLGYTGDAVETLNAFKTASDLSPDSWTLAIVWGNYAEAFGQPDLAREAYGRALSIDDQAALDPHLIASPIGQTMIATHAITGFPQVIQLYVSGDRTGAQTALDALTPVNTQMYVMRAVIALDRGDREAALRDLEVAETLKVSGYRISEAWALYGWTRYHGEDLAIVRDFMQRDLLDADYSDGLNFARALTLRDMLPRMFLPQVGYQAADPLLLSLIGVVAD
ncbi:MAG: O-antigen ligase family protein [Anaerolineae bacterium]|nr:O-antigen ligase family protein [Anaerolineae bacterium]